MRVSSDRGAEEQAEAVATGTGAAVTTMADDGEPPPASARAILERPDDAGRPLPATVRDDLEARLGYDLAEVRLHHGPAARSLTDSLGARALTVGTDIYVGDSNTDSAGGRRILAHEVTHVLQQAAAPKALIQLHRRPGKVTHTITSITLFVDRDLVVLELDGKDTVTLKAVYNGRPAPGSYKVESGRSTPAIRGATNARGWVVEWRDPPGDRYTKASSFTFNVVAGRPGSDEGPAKGLTDEGGGKEGGDRAGRTTDGIGGGTKGTGPADTGEGAGSKTAVQTGPGDDPAGAGGEATVRLTPEEEAIWRQIAQLMKGAGGAAGTESPAEVVRLFKVLRAVVVEPKFGTTGESWIKFAHFLDQNRDKIEGYFRSESHGRVTSAVLEKIVREYGAFLAMTKDQEGPRELKTDADFDKEFKYDPGWRHLSPADRKLLLDYSRRAGGAAGDKKIEFLKVGTSQKIMMALRMADTSLLGEVAEAAKNAFTDPAFIITLIVSMGIYVGLWLTPDPSWVTKLAAGALTVAMLAQFSYHDIYGFATAWSDLSDACTTGTTVDELKAAGESFFKRIGPIGFDIMMFIVMWRIGKKVGPKLSKIGAEMNVNRAQRVLDTAEARPGSGAKTITEAGPSPLDQARATAGPGAGPTEILDALAKVLPESARQGLAAFRAKVADANVLRALEGSKAPLRLLTEKAMTPEQAQAARAQATQARFDLARAKLIAADTIKDPGLRKTVRTEQAQAIKNILQEAGAWDTPEFQDAFLRGDISTIGRMLRQVMDKVRSAARDARSTETQGAIGESIQRAILRTQYAGRPAARLISNLAIMKRLPGIRSVADWIAAERARIKAEDPTLSDEDLMKQVKKSVAKLFEKDGTFYVGIGEIDTMVVERGFDGRLHVLELAEAKTGAASPAEARGQLTDALAELGEIGKGTSPAQVFEMQGKRVLGDDITRDLALDSLQQPPTRVFGPEGDKIWDVTLGYNEAEFKAMADSLVRNLPPDEPATPRPPTAPRDEDKEPAH